MPKSYLIYAIKGLLFSMITKKKFTVSMSEKLVDKIDGRVSEGRHASRSECIETCVKQVFKMEESDERFMELVIELMELAAKSPEFVEEYKKALKKV